MQEGQGGGRMRLCRWVRAVGSGCRRGESGRQLGSSGARDRRRTGRKCRRGSHRSGLLRRLGDGDGDRCASPSWFWCDLRPRGCGCGCGCRRLYLDSESRGKELRKKNTCSISRRTLSELSSLSEEQAPRLERRRGHPCPPEWLHSRELSVSKAEAVLLLLLLPREACARVALHSSRMYSGRADLVSVAVYGLPRRLVPVGGRSGGGRGVRQRGRARVDVRLTALALMAAKSIHPVVCGGD